MTDYQRAADIDNPKGYYEYERAKQLPQGNNEWLLEARGKTLKIISALLPYLPMICPYRIIFMERELQEVLASQRKMMVHRIEDHTNTVTDNEMTEHLQQHLYEVETWLRVNREHLSCLRMNYNAVLKQPDIHIKQLNRYLGGNLDLAGMISVIDPALYRNRSE